MTSGRDSANLDVLRAFAVTAVVASHLMLLFNIAPRPLHWLGNFGVLIFFVHTSLVLTLSMERMRVTNFGDLYAKFITQRAFRIYPLSIFCVLVIWLLNLPLGHLSNGVFSLDPVDARLLWSNLLLVQNLTGAQYMLAPLWSLPLEVQMYVLLPFLFLLATRVDNVIPILLLWIGAVVAAMLVPGGGDFLDYIPCFMGGVIAFKLTKTYKKKLPYYFWPVALAVVAAAYLSKIPGREGWITCLALGALIPLFEDMPDNFISRVAAIVARYSYGIYLAHFFCLWLGFAYFHALPFWMQCGVFASTLIVLPIAFYHLIEHPFVQLGKRITRPRPLVAAPAPAA